MQKEKVVINDYIHIYARKEYNTIQVWQGNIEWFTINY